MRKVTGLCIKEIWLLTLKHLLVGQGLTGIFAMDGATEEYHFCTLPPPCYCKWASTQPL